VLRRSFKRYHLPSKCAAGSLANTRLDLRNAANSLQIEGKGGCYLGTHPIGGDLAVGRRDHIYLYINIYI
jgi:hypothetical protein